MRIFRSAVAGCAAALLALIAVPVAAATIDRTRWRRIYSRRSTAPRPVTRSRSRLARRSSAASRCRPRAVSRRSRFAPRARTASLPTARASRLRTRGGLAILRAEQQRRPAIRTAAGAHHWRLMLLEVQGDGRRRSHHARATARARRRRSPRSPHDLVVDRLYIHGDAEKGQKRGIALNSASTTITGSYISDIKVVGQDSQAICGWNGPGPYAITNNYLEAAGENVMFGGSDPSVPNLVPADITVADNYVTKAGGVASGKMECQEPDRAQERPARDDSGQPLREQLGGRAARVRDRVHGPKPGRQVHLVPGRSRDVRAEHRATHALPASRSSAGTTTIRASRRRRS